MQLERGISFNVTAILREGDGFAIVTRSKELDYLDGPNFQGFWDTDGERTTRR